MRSLTTLLVMGLCSSAALASPIGGAQAKRKPPRAEMPVEQLERFVHGLLADRQGNLELAIQQYEGLRGRGYAEVHFNLADLFRRSELVEQALRAYRDYLRAAPDAADHQAVEKLVEVLERAPGLVSIGGVPAPGVLMLDGKRVANPFVGGLVEGAHQAEWITPTGFDRTHVNVRRPATQSITLRARPRAGNVIITGTSRDLQGGSWRDGDVEYRMHEPFTLKPGTYRTVLVKDNHGCSPLAFEVAPAPAVTYVFIQLRARTAGGCFPFTVTQERVTFGGTAR